MRRLCVLLLGICLACQQQPSQAQSPTPTPRTGLSGRLLKEKSPYLRQHADNEVDWYAWGPEAFEKAKKEDKPIFLSVGYSTCHWCHVMERESFMDKKVGAFLNEHFVAIKVDRETRPDVDRLYMNFVTSTTGSGGWPMTVFMTPEGQPFFGGTYFPNPPKYNRMGFLELAERIHKEWTDNRASLTQHSQALAEKLASSDQWPVSADLPSKKVMDQAVQGWRKSFDEMQGGFGSAPKFPNPSNLDFMLRYAHQNKDSGVERMVFKTLDAMATGGLRDQLDGGFHRYSTDAKWLVPHFEKMLYDQALLAEVYCDAYAWTGKPLYKEAVTTTLDYLTRRMSGPDGGICSAEDADSSVPGNEEEHAEGAYYVWTEAELQQVLNEDEFKLAKEIYGTQSGGNAETDTSGELEGKNILSLSVETPPVELEAIRMKLLKARESRPRPLRDDKIISEWNAMAAVAFAQAGRQLQRPDYTQQSRKIMDFLEKSLMVDGQLRRSYLEGSAQGQAFASDYAQMVAAYLALYQTEGEPRDLLRAIELQKLQRRLFWDPKDGAFFETTESTDLLYRPKTLADGATWSANSQSALNLMQLHRLTGVESYREDAETIFKATTNVLKRSARAMPGVLCALDLWYGSNESVVIVTELAAWWDVVRSGYHPQRTAIWLKDTASRESLSPLIEHIAELPERKAAYICKNFSCGLPIESLEELQMKLNTP